MNGTPKYDIIVCGSLHLDIVVNAPELPRIDETAVGSRWQQICGGKGGNQAVQSACAGAKTAMIGCIGQDDFGETLLTNLKNAGVDTSAISVDPVTGSGMSVAILQNNGEYGAVIVSGSNLNIDAAALADIWRELGSAKMLVLQNEVPHNVNVAAAIVARSHDAKVVFNAGPARALAPDLDALIDVLVVNRVEAEMISGRPIVDRASVKSCLPILGGDWRAVVITLGGSGIVMQDSGGPIIEIEPISVNVTSTHGAGDCFIGALAAELTKAHDLEFACRAANKKAAAFVSRKLE